MEMQQDHPQGNAPFRELLPTRRFNRSLSIECEGHSYRATAGFLVTV